MNKRKGTYRKPSRFSAVVPINFNIWGPTLRRPVHRVQPRGLMSLVQQRKRFLEQERRVAAIQLAAAQMNRTA
jgi:hypothetical protein